MGKSARLVDLDALSLLTDSGDLRPRRELKPEIERPTPKARVVIVTPAPGKKKGKKDGRDEMLSEYLSSLGRIPLLTAEDEIRIAKALREAEVGCWSRLLGIKQAVDAVAASPLLADNDFKQLEALARLQAHNPLPDDVLKVADALREADDDRALVCEVIAAIAQLSPSKTDKLANEARVLRARALDLRNRFVRANLRLVVSVARRFHHYRLPLIDLIQEGNLGLIKSVHRFDHTKGFRFSTYAHWWIRQAIERAIMNKGAQVRLPVHMFDARRELQKATRDLHQKLGRDPSTAEIAKELALPVEKLEEILRAVPREPVSLDDPVGDDEERTLGEVICNQDDALPDERVIQAAEKRWVRRVLMRLSPMEVDILVRRFGIDTDDDETLEEIGKTYNLSRERVRQIQVASLKKMQRYVEVRRAG